MLKLKPTRTILVPVLFALGIIAYSIDVTHAAAATTKSASSEDIRSSVTNGVNQFSSAFHNVLRSSNSNTTNLVTSPLSISTVMAMAYAGAGGDTATAISSSLRFPPDDENELYSGYQALLQELEGDKNVTLNLVNKLYPDEGFEVDSTFVSTLKSYFGAEPQQLNFSQPEKVAATINSFVENATNNKIRDIISVDDLTTTTKLIILNAVYFKGTWKYQFDKDSTHKWNFTVPGQPSPVAVDMMSLITSQQESIRCGYLKEIDADVAVLPYDGDNGLHMIILVPGESSANSLSEMEDKLSSQTWTHIFGGLRTQPLRLKLPKFKIESSIDLRQPLTQLGAGVMFDTRSADFSRISKNESLYVSKAVHKAFIKVNEEGSEAAASTSLSFATRTHGPRGHIIFANRPFKAVIGKVTEVEEKVEVLPLFVAQIVKVDGQVKVLPLIFVS